MIRRFFIAILFLVTVTFPAWAEVYEVIIDDTGFHPEKIEILSGDTVKWINKGTTVHSATGEGFDSGPLSPGLNYEHTFDGLNTLTHLPLEISYGDMKGGYKGKIVVDNSTLEISPRDSKFLDDQKITMTIFCPSIFWVLKGMGGGPIKVFYDGTLIYEGSILQLVNALMPVESSGVVVEPSMGIETLVYYLSFSLPPFSLPPGIHQISIEAEYRGKKLRDSVTYTVFHRKPIVGVPY